MTFRVGPNDIDERDASHTTPEASEIQRLLREMVDHGCKACAMEVSSHALVLHRVANLRFAAAIFTNLTRDHLDFHGDMQQYFAAKRRLFEMLPAGAPAIVNVDDPRGVELTTTPVARGDLRPRQTGGRQSQARCSRHSRVWRSTSRRRAARLTMRSPLVGRPNVYNILGVVAAAIALDLPDAAIDRGIAAARHACPVASRSSPPSPTTSASSSTTRTPTMR